MGQSYQLDFDALPCKIAPDEGPDVEPIPGLGKIKDGKVIVLTKELEGHPQFRVAHRLAVARQGGVEFLDSSNAYLYRPTASPEVLLPMGKERRMQSAMFGLNDGADHVTIIDEDTLMKEGDDKDVFEIGRRNFLCDEPFSDFERDMVMGYSAEGDEGMSEYNDGTPTNDNASERSRTPAPMQTFGEGRRKRMRGEDDDEMDFRTAAHEASTIFANYSVPRRLIEINGVRGIRVGADAKRVVWVRPDRPSDFWWPAVIVPPDEISDKVFALHSLQNKDLGLVRYLEDSSLCVFTKARRHSTWKLTISICSFHPCATVRPLTLLMTFSWSSIRNKNRTSRGQQSTRTSSSSMSRLKGGWLCLKMVCRIKSSGGRFGMIASSPTIAERIVR